jgi:hypothetical protein
MLNIFFSKVKYFNIMLKILINSCIYSLGLYFVLFIKIITENGYINNKISIIISIIILIFFDYIINVNKLRPISQQFDLWL